MDDLEGKVIVSRKSWLTASAKRWRLQPGNPPEANRQHDPA
jgi:hypothetical protein